MKKKILGLVLAISMVGGLIAGCSSTSKGGGDSDDGESTGAEYAVILKTLSNPFWVSMKEGIEKEAEKLGVKVDIYAAQSEEDTEGQLKILESCLDKDYKAIGVAPLSPVNLIPAIVKANEKGIYVMNIDEKVDMDSLKSSGGSVIGFATTDNVKVGEKGAQYIIDQLADGGEVAIIEGKAGNASGESRKEGATKAFKSNSKFNLVSSQPADWDRQKAIDVATSYIQKYPNLKAIYACNDTMALGALQAVKNANKLGEIIVVGTDGAPEALESIEAGELSATVAQDSAGIGAVSLSEMVQAVKDKVEINKDVEAKEIPVDSKLVTK